MISKRIHRKAGTSDIARLTRYVLDAPHWQEAILTMTPEDYQHHLIEQPGNKLVAFTLTNCEATVPAVAIAEMRATQQKNTRAKMDKTYHLVVSFPAEEYPRPAQLQDIEATLCEALGYQDHQRLSAVHDDTDNLHLHIVINKVHPETLRCHEPYRDYYRRDKACIALEQKHQLQADNHQKHRNWAENQKQAEKTVVSNLPDGHPANLPTPFGGDEQALEDWLKTTLKPALLEAPSWEVLHQLLAPYQLAIKPRGAGLVITQIQGTLSVKASHIDRQLSLAKLSQKLGVFVPRKAETLTQGKTAHPEKKPDAPKRIYKQKGLSSLKVENTSLYAQYKTSQQAALQTRKAARQHLSAEYQEETEQLRTWARTRRKLIKENRQFNANEKRIAYKALSYEVQRDKQRLQEQRRIKGQTLAASFPPVSWDSFIQAQANAGNAAALGVVNAKKRRKLPVWDAISTSGSHPPSLKVTPLPTIPHDVNNRGERIYTAADGGRITDQVKQIQVDKVSQQAIMLALELAVRRFEDKPLRLQGSEAFKQAVIATAAQRWPALRFETEPNHNIATPLSTQTRTKQPPLELSR